MQGGSERFIHYHSRHPHPHSHTHTHSRTLAYQRMGLHGCQVDARLDGSDLQAKRVSWREMKGLPRFGVSLGDFLEPNLFHLPRRWEGNARKEAKSEETQSDVKER